MIAELDRHASVACASPDLATDQAEAAADANRMTTYAGHLWDRCNQMMAVLDARASTWGGVMQGCATAP
jgi:hypothetical protein